MRTIKIIQATPGLTTTERIEQLIENHPQGITIKELSRTLNRPISMVQICLKSLISWRKVYAKPSKSGMHLIYYSKKSLTRKV
ncbi:MAG: hypothetical protein QNJ54_10255 [Prochloraceae cyanobacterium]|nr:hypothetical protein [Prochloraceae cyanobacterium]